ncbi:alanine/glycine:cation symporter family protein [Ferruginivarius sediminum]|uniref:Sodium:alanine symporter family protein n=1 Tax=Ferruginivarius sediminum TaxID=2661937 RepID=A0A369TA72_9PROT|nr:sodium:alanine symporter family protein [Ferruginivarius sediminum]RDD61275.1 sodium:alanine symporter family protein [Ferruginivarius sediminum]
MDAIRALVSDINGIVWGVPMLVLILGTGLYLMVRLRFMPLISVGASFRLMWQGRRSGPDELGEISPFAALMTALAATVGTGNIAGVATAIALGGPGALFWMWCTALVGLATKYSEVLLSVHYREVDEKGDHVGGPMYAIKNGLGRNWMWLGAAFAIFGGLAGFGIGNTVQSNAVADVLETSFGIPEWVSGVIVMVLVGLVVLGGIKRIGRVAEALVPTMCVAYVVFALVVLAINIAEIPAAIGLVFAQAFTPTAATGGFAGAAVWAAIQFGVARGVFSNEAGLGTAGIAQAAGTTTNPVRSGLIGMTGTFIDTIIVCTMTGLAIITSGAWMTGESGANLTSAAFEMTIPGVGGYLVAVSLAVFAFTTILGWAYYCEKCWQYLVGAKSEIPFRILWTLVVPAGAIAELDFVWLLADTLNAFMAVPNLIALLLLSPMIVRLTGSHMTEAVGSRAPAE